MRAPAGGSRPSGLAAWRELASSAARRHLAIPLPFPFRQPASARVALAVAFAIFLLACLAAGWLSLASLPGFGFAAGAVIAAGSVRRRELLMAVVAPPALFLLAVGCAGLLSAWQSGAQISPLPLAAACLLTLSAAAPWIFGGLAGAVVLAEVSGLHGCVRDLRAALAAQPDRPARTKPARTKLARTSQARASQAGNPARARRGEAGLPDQEPFSGRSRLARGAARAAKRR